ncbi:MAG: flagellar export chaperone FlgN [Terriglobales bacterium]
MNNVDTSLPELAKLAKLIEQRLALVGTLADSLESSTHALGRNDAEAIARGAAHQAELCRQWSCLEDQLRREAPRRSRQSSAGSSLAGASAGTSAAGTFATSPEAEHLAQLEAEWDTLGARIRYLTRVHWSLLRHLERSLAVLNRVVESCASTYTPDPGLLRRAVRPGSGGCAGE